MADICCLYPRRNGTIWKHEGAKRWMPWRKPLQDAQLLGAMADDWRSIYRGCYFDGSTRFAVLDIDQGSKYHNGEYLAALADDLETAGLTAKPYQSSESGGWHLYLFLDDWEASCELEQTLKAWLKAKGYEIKSGTLEVFPSGNALRLPLQKGFGWLNSNGTLIKRRENMTRDEAISSFLSDLEKNKRSWTNAKNLMDRQSVLGNSSSAGRDQAHEKAIDREGLEDIFNRGIDWDKYQRGREYWEKGLTAFKQRNDAVLCIGHYLWFGDEAAGIKKLPGTARAAQRADLIYGWLERRHNGFSRAVNSKSFAAVKGEIERACSWAAQQPQIRNFEPYPLTERVIKRLEFLFRVTGRVWTIDDLKKGNEGRAKNAFERIAIAVAQLEVENKAITKSAVAKKSGASRCTVRKYFSTWQGCTGDSIGGALEPFPVSGFIAANSDFENIDSVDFSQSEAEPVEDSKSLSPERIRCFYASSPKLKSLPKAFKCLTNDFRATGTVEHRWVEKPFVPEAQNCYKNRHKLRLYLFVPALPAITSRQLFAVSAVSPFG